MKPKITMTFDAQGGVQTTVEGARGRSCTDLTDFLDREFGAGERTLKPDYCLPTTEVQTLGRTP